MSESQSRDKRKYKNILINPRFQLKYVLLAAGAGLILTVANATLFYRYVSENYSILVDLSPMTDEAKAQLYAELRTMVAFLSVSSLIFVMIVGWIALLISHKTAGPLYHFRRIFEEVRVGNKQARIHLRPNDDFRDVAHSFNQMMDSITGKGPSSRSE